MLLVDDDSVIHQLVPVLLGSPNIELMSATDGPRALKITPSAKWRADRCAVEPPRADGVLSFPAQRFLRSDLRSRHMPSSVCRRCHVYNTNGGLDLGIDPLCNTYTY